MNGKKEKKKEKQTNKLCGVAPHVCEWKDPAHTDPRGGPPSICKMKGVLVNL